MNTTIDFLEMAKAKTGAVSDYALAKFLGVKTQTISVWRCGRGGMSDETALKVASILEIEPFLVLAAVHAERAKTAPEKAAWKAAFEKLGGIAAAVTLGIMLSAPQPAGAAASADTQARSNSTQSIHYAK